MSVDPASLLQLLHKLEQQIDVAPEYTQALRTALQSHNVLNHVFAKLAADRHLNAMAQTTAQIKAQVIVADPLGAQVKSLSELALRATGLILRAELIALREATCGLSACGRSVALFRPPLASVDQLAAIICAELDRVMRLWDEDRGVTGGERVAYREALRVAHGAMRRLGRESDVARFLRNGRAQTDWPELSTVCTRMLAAIQVRIDTDPDLPLLVYAQSSPDRSAREIKP